MEKGIEKTPEHSGCFGVDRLFGNYILNVAATIKDTYDRNKEIIVINEIINNIVIYRNKSHSN